MGFFFLENSYREKISAQVIAPDEQLTKIYTVALLYTIFNQNCLLQ